MAALRHPNVLAFMGLCSSPPCLVSEYCPRGSLYDVLRRANRSPELGAELTWAVRLQMASLLHQGPARGANHRIRAQPVVQMDWHAGMPALGAVVCQHCPWRSM